MKFWIKEAFVTKPINFTSQPLQYDSNPLINHLTYLVILTSRRDFSLRKSGSFSSTRSAQQPFHFSHLSILKRA